MEFQGKTQDAVSDFDRQVYDSIGKGQWLPNAFKQYMVEYLALNQPLIPVGQLVGFSKFILEYAEVTADETTTSTSYADLATVGPTITGLPSGVYAVFYGAKQYGASGAISSISVNGAAASDNDSVNGDSSAAAVSVGRMNKVTLTGQNNTITLKYRTGSAGTVGFIRRYIATLRISSV